MRHELFELERALVVAERPLELAVIIPTFNEVANVERLLSRLAIVLADISWEAVFVDDNSPDGTADAVRKIALDNRHVRIVHRIGRRGLSTAVIEGMLASAAPILAVIDGDMQHDESVLPRLFDQIKSGKADIAAGTRYAEGGGTGDWDSSRLRASQFATWLGQKVIKTPLSDPMSGFFAISREALMKAVPHLSAVGFKILLDIVASMPQPPRVAEEPYTFRSREEGESKASARIGAEYIALLADKLIGHIIPIRLLSFLLIGGLGVGIHLGALGLGLASGVTFLAAQIFAVMLAMTFNFFLNNIFTYHDRQLRGWKMLGGLLSFYAVCGVGAIGNIGIGTWLNGQNERWWVAGLAGVLIGAVWNFAASALVTWRR